MSIVLISLFRYITNVDLFDYKGAIWRRGRYKRMVRSVALHRQNEFFQNFILNILRFDWFWVRWKAPSPLLISLFRSIANAGLCCFRVHLARLTIQSHHLAKWPYSAVWWRFIVKTNFSEFYTKHPPFWLILGSLKSPKSPAPIYVYKNLYIYR